jgi:hypothetical protein
MLAIQMVVQPTALNGILVVSSAVLEAKELTFRNHRTRTTMACPLEHVFSNTTTK